MFELVKASLRRVVMGDDDADKAKRPLADLKKVADRRASSDRVEKDADFKSESRSAFVDVLGADYPMPDWLVTEQYVEEVMGTVKGGKEGEVKLVVRSSAERDCLLALKVYKDARTRAFHRDQIYREGRKIRSTRVQKAIERGTRVGRAAMNEDWEFTEFAFLRKLWILGADVPYPVAFGGGLLMEYIGDDDLAAPRLVNVSLDRNEAPKVLEGILDNVRLFAVNNVVHADLSPYNVLYWQGRGVIIDFPQAVDIARNPHGIDLLRRDLFNICKHFKKYGIEKDPDVELASILAECFEMGVTPM